MVPTSASSFIACAASMIVTDLQSPAAGVIPAATYSSSSRWSLRDRECPSYRCLRRRATRQRRRFVGRFTLATQPRAAASIRFGSAAGRLVRTGASEATAGGDARQEAARAPPRPDARPSAFQDWAEPIAVPCSSKSRNLPPSGLPIGPHSAAEPTTEAAAIESDAVFERPTAAISAGRRTGRRRSADRLRLPDDGRAPTSGAYSSE